MTSTIVLNMHGDKNHLFNDEYLAQLRSVAKTEEYNGA